MQDQDISSDNTNSRNVNIKNSENICLNKFDIGLFNRSTTKQVRKILFTIDSFYLKRKTI
jgi:hypothetical protein